MALVLNNLQRLYAIKKKKATNQPTNQGVEEGATPFPGLLHFTLDTYLIMLSVRQGNIKNYFLSLWYDSTWDWIAVSQAFGEYSNHWENWLIQFKQKKKIHIASKKYQKTLYVLDRFF